MDVQIELVKAMGENPTPISWPEVCISIATGVVYGEKWHQGYRGDEVPRAFEAHHVGWTCLHGALWFFNQARWQQFPRTHQLILFDSFQHQKTTALAFPMCKQVPTYEDFKKTGGTIYVPTLKKKLLTKLQLHLFIIGN
ncbi:MAG: hypothetical protein P8O70_05840 [SAR324 cluster bacterium]|nr:hypothetical protein [SAR324 cluster bacterium]